MNPVYRFIKEAVASNDDILAVARQYYDNDDPDDPKHRWDHMLDVMDTAKKIRKRELNPEEFGMIAFHDAGYKHPKGYAYAKSRHPMFGAKIFRKEGPKLGYSPEGVKHIAKVIAYHNHKPDYASSPLLKDDMQMLLFSADEGTPIDLKDDAKMYYVKGRNGVYKGVDPNSKDFIKQLVAKVKTFGNYSKLKRLKYYNDVYPGYLQSKYDFWQSPELEKYYKELDKKDKKKVKKAEFDLPDLQTNPKNKMTRLTKNLVWGVKVDGEPISDNGILFKLDPNKGYEIVGDNNGNVASCVDLTNKVVKNMRGVGALATMRSDGTVPHLTPLFKYKGKYYLRSGTHKYSDPYDSLEEIGKRWFKSDSSYPVPEYVDFYDLPAGTTINEKDLRKVIDEVKRKSRKSYRRDYTDREGYKKEKKASKSDEKRLEEARKFVEAVRRMALKKKLNFFLVTDGASGISNNGNPAVRNAREAQIKWELENGSDPYEDWGTKQAGKLYTYVDPEADLSKGLLSARLAPEEVLMRRYPNSGAKNKKELLELMQTRFKDDKDRPNLIYALSSPIPDTANSKLLRFRANHKLVSYDTDKIKDLVKLLKRRYRKPPVEVKDVEPRKYVQWGRDPKDAGAFFYAPVYKVLTESGKIDPELLEEIV